MTHLKFYTLLDELLEFEPGTIKADDLLKDYSRWDSLAVIGFIALIDQHFGTIVPVVRIINAKTASDLAKLVCNNIAN